MEDSIKIVCPSCSVQLEVDEEAVVSIIPQAGKSEAKADDSSVGEGAGTGTGEAVNSEKAAEEGAEDKGNEEGV